MWRSAAVLLFAAPSVAAGGPVPPDDDWAKRYEAGHLMWSPSIAKLMPYVGNGYLATHPISEVPAQSGTIYVAGLFNGIAVSSACDGFFCNAPHRARVPSYRVAVVNPSDASPSAKGLSAEGGYAMDFDLAELIHRQSIGSLKVESRYYAHLDRKHVLVHEIVLDNTAGNSDVNIGLNVSLGGASSDINFAASSTSDGVYVYAACGFVQHMERPDMPRTLVAMAANIPPIAVFVPAGSKTSRFFLTTVATSLDSKNPEQTAFSELKSAFEAGKAGDLRPSHERLWANRWQAGHMEIAGNLPLAQAVNASTYFILSSLREDWPQGLSPGGLASDSYNGHSFWDCETWMYPNLLLLQPDLAKAMLQYRLDRLDGARAKARASGYAGLMFPWESAWSGYEVQGFAGGQIGPWGKFEHHISGDIAFAATQYWQVSGDDEFLRSSLEPLLRGIAEFWASRVQKQPDGFYHIHHVMCPDEYHSNVNDSVYTNWVAKLSLEAAADAAEAVKREPGNNWSTIAKNMYIPFDEKSAFHPEYEGYAKGTDVKQGDAILLGFPFLMNARAEVRVNDLAVYDAVTDPGGPAMTWAMFAVGWLEAGNFAKAEDNFLRGYANAQAPFNVWTETPTGGAVNFITGAGGFLQSVLYGYTGLRIRAGGLDLEPKPLPTNTTEIRLAGVHYLGNRINITVSADSLFVSVITVHDLFQRLELLDRSSGKAEALSPWFPIVRPRDGKYRVKAAVIAKKEIFT